jgi:hypothetical protein
MLKIRQHRAIDMDATKKVLIVVEEAASSFQSRRVHMYRPSMYITTYRPPTVHFQPSDVCFHHMNGQELLLISDEANHAIHVFRVGEKKMTFLRYLTLNHPLLQLPTAMNVDQCGCLWVAGKGGNIVTVEPTCKCSSSNLTGLLQLIHQTLLDLLRVLTKK